MIALTHDRIDAAALRAAVVRPEHGSVILFEGITRNHFDGRPVVHLDYEAYDAMAIAEMTAIQQELEAAHPGIVVAMVHRLGRVPLGEASVIIAVGSPHRAEGYDASRHAIDALKARVPIWKKEVYADGHAWKANAPA